MASTSEWSSSMKDSIALPIVGSALIVIAMLLIVWNECKVSRLHRLLVAADAQCHRYTSPDAKFDQLEHQPIHMTGRTETPASELLVDPDTGLSFPHCSRIHRRVERLQWVERRTTSGEFMYTKEWCISPISSSSFKEPTNHKNPTDEWVINTWEKTVSTVHFGQAFRLASNQIANMIWYRQRNLQQMGDQSRLSSSWSGVALQGGYLYRLLTGTVASPDIGDYRISYHQVEDGPISVMGSQCGDSFEPWTDGSCECLFDLCCVSLVSAMDYVFCCRSCRRNNNRGGLTSSNPYQDVDLMAQIELGDIKRSSLSAHASTFTVGDAITTVPTNTVVIPAPSSPVTAPRANRPGRSHTTTRRLSLTTGVHDHLSIGVACNPHPFKILWVNLGQISCERMIEQRRIDRTVILWSCRLLSYLLMFIGALLLFQPVDDLLSSVPYISTFSSVGVWLVAICTSFPLWLATIAVSWLSARPVPAFITLAIDAAVVVIVALLTGVNY